MSEESARLFDEKELTDIIIGLNEAVSKLHKTPQTRQDWADWRDRIDRHLKKFKDFALKHKAAQFNIQASIGIPPKVDVGLSFNLKE